MRTIGIVMLASALTAQAPNAEGLLSPDWRQRNEAAKALLAAPPDERNLPVLIRALATSSNGLDDGGVFYGLGGGAGWPAEPRADSIRDATELVTPGSGNRFFPITVPSVDELIIPWSSDRLATVVLCDHIERDGQWRRQLAHIAPDTRDAAHVWVRCKPSPKQVVEALADERFAVPVARKLWSLGDTGKDLLKHALVHGSREVQKTVLDINAGELADTGKGIPIAVHHFVEGEQETFKAAGGVVRQLGAKAIPQLIAACKGPDYARGRALAMLTVLGKQAAPAARALVDCIGLEGEEWSTNQALTALASIEIPRHLRAEVVAKALRVLENGSDYQQVLALDAIGNCKGGVDKATTARLRKMLEAKPGFFQAEPYRNARLLACLQRLGEVPKLSKWRRRALTRHKTTNIDALLAASATDDEPAKYALALVLRGRLDTASEDALIAAAVKWDKALVQAELAGPVDHAHRAALVTLQKVDPDSVTTESLLQLVRAERRYPSDHERAALATAMLWQRAGTKEMAEQVVDAEIKVRSLTDAGIKFVRLLKLSPQERITRLEPVLRLGENWELVADASKATMRKLCREWLAEAEDHGTRYELRDRLCELGFDSEEDVEQMRADLKADLRLLGSIKECPTLPEALRQDIVALLAREDLQAWDRLYARRVLIQFAGT